MTTADALPEDLPSLRATALALLAERDELLRRVERMRDIIRQFQRAQFGRRSEQLDPDQLQLTLEEREIAGAHEEAAAAKQGVTPRPRPEPGTRKSLPAHLPRVEIIVRGDSHYGRPEAMSWCERQRVGYIFGLAGNPVLLGTVRNFVRG